MSLLVGAVVMIVGAMSNRDDDQQSFLIGGKQSHFSGHWRTWSNLRGGIGGTGGASSSACAYDVDSWGSEA